MEVFWSALLERSVGDVAVNSLMNVAAQGAVHGFKRIVVPYGRTDLVRNLIVQGFMKYAKDPNDVLVMLDNDHQHPPTVVESLAAHDPELGVVGALAFRRGEPYDPCFWVRNKEGEILGVDSWPEGAIIECISVGSGAIAIRRWVFEKMSEYAPIYFQYAYSPEDKIAFQPSEDVVFARRCEKLGIKHYVDTSVVIPHITNMYVTKETYNQFKEKKLTEAENEKTSASIVNDSGG